MKNAFLTQTNQSWAGFIARIFAGGVLFPHGAQKLLGAFGGNGLEKTLSFFTTIKQLPLVVAWMVIIIEFFGSLCLILGIFPRIWAMAIIGLFTGIVFNSNAANGFFMNWTGQQRGEGFEFALLMLGLCIIVVITGGGKFTIHSQNATRSRHLGGR